MPLARRLTGALVTLALGLSIAACSSGGGGDVATVNGQKISKTDFDNRMEAGPAGKQTLQQMVQGILIDQYAKDNNIAVTDDEIAKKEEDIKAKYPPGQFDQILKQQGLTEDDVHRILRQQIIIEKAVGSSITITDAQVKAYFDKNHTTLDKPAQVRARHILVPDQKTAIMIEGKLKAGGDFAMLAKQYSTDPSTKDKGGELGFFGKGQMVPAFQDAAFSLPVGSISQPVKSPFGWHIIQVEEKKPAIKATLAASAASIRDQLKQQQGAQQIPLFLQTLRSKANIVIDDPALQGAFPSPPPAAAPAGAAPAASGAAASPAPAST
jgi:foldase protein PrsA